MDESAPRSDTNAFLADSSAFGLLLVGGKDRVSLLQRITSNDQNKLAPGAGGYGCFTSAKGRVIDRTLFLAGAEATLLVTSPGRSDAVAKWIDRYVITEDVKVADLSHSVAQLHLVGTAALAIGSAIDPRVGNLARHGHVTCAIAGIEPLTLAVTEGLLDAPGVLVIGPREKKDAIVAALDAATRRATGAPLTILSDTELDAKRIAAGLPRYGVDVTEENNPLECGLWDSVSFDKGCYVGQEVVARLRNYDKVMKQLCALSGAAGGAAADGAAIAPGTPLYSGDRDVGKLTSVAHAPDGSWRAIGFVNRRVVQAGGAIAVGSAGGATANARAIDLR